jgi:DNA-directed RNA polymerase subunit RPC12/RpoP
MVCECGSEMVEALNGWYFCTRCYKAYTIPKQEKEELNTYYGWVCPKCGQVNAPWISTCSCSKKWKITC